MKDFQVEANTTDTTDASGDIPLHTAAAENTDATVAVLLKNGVAPNLLSLDYYCLLDNCDKYQVN